jgi:hypothetical protein
VRASRAGSAGSVSKKMPRRSGRHTSITPQRYDEGYGRGKILRAWTASGDSIYWIYRVNREELIR